MEPPVGVGARTASLEGTWPSGLSLSSSQEPLIAWGPIILDCENEIEHLLTDEGLNENWSHRTPEIAQPNNLPVGKQV